MLSSIENLKDAEQVYTGYLEIEKLKVIQQEKDNTIVDIEALLKSPYPGILLYELLSEYNFNSSVINKIYESLDSDSGKQFYSKTHRVVKDRKNLFVTKIEEKEDRIYYVEEGDIELFEPMDLNLEKLSLEEFEMIKSPQVACLDFDLLEFPLLIRKWQQGDYFQPLGMTGFKKVSDFFIDEKLPLHEKENTWIMCSGNKIVWIMGQRIDNRFKVTPQSKQVLKIEIR